MKRLILLDGHAIIHRAYHALPELTTRNGQPVNAVYGFANMLLKVIDTLNPTHMVVAFDLPIATFRHEAYIGYQSHRPTLDDGLKSQISLVRELVEAAGIKVVSCPGFEADDAIGTLAVKAVNEAAFDDVIIVTGDRDILQLVNHKVKVYMPIKGISEARLFEEKDVEEYLGIKPNKVVEYKALVGDSSDNYPGIPGIGPRTAITLLKNFGSIESIYSAVKRKTQSAKRIPSKVLEKLGSGYEGAVLSHKLATIVTDVPIEINFEETKIEDVPHRREFLDKIREFGFKSLYKRLTGDTPVPEKPRPTKKKNNGQMGLL